MAPPNPPRVARHHLASPVVVLDFRRDISAVKDPSTDAALERGRLAQLFGQASSRASLAQFEGTIPLLRAEYGIPNPPAGRLYGGWIVTSPKYRRIDFYFTTDESPDAAGAQKERPVVYRLLDSLKDIPHAVARQISNLYQTRWGVDLPLSLVVTQRESTRRGFGDSDRLIDTFDMGGLDSLYHEQKNLRNFRMTPQGFPHLAPSPKPASSKINERGNPIEPALLPEKHAIEAYGAMLNLSRLRFFMACIRTARMYRLPELDVNSISVRALRVWTIFFFGLSAPAKACLRRYRRTKRSLDGIVGDEKAAEDHACRRGLLNAAEAELLEQQLGFPPATRWRITLGGWSVPRP